MEKRLLMFENIDWIMLIGQALGIVAVILGFVTYQMKSPKALLIVNLITCGVFCLHYLMIGAYSGMALNIISVIRNFTYFQLGKKGSVAKGWAIAFSIVMGVMGVLSWQNWYSIFVVLGLIINSYCMSFSNPQNIRKSILVTSPLVLIYDVLVLSVGGAVYESIAIVSAVIGIVRTYKKQPQ